MAEQISHINVRAAWRRALLLALAALAVAWAWYGVRWCAGATLAEHARDISTAEAATRLAPENPNSYRRLAHLRRARFLPEDMPAALQAFERAAALAPHDRLAWGELGRARGEAGDAEGAVEALRRAVELAPNYSRPRWHLGNALLRAGRTEEGFAELRRAADAEPALRPQVFNLAWQFYRQDMPRVIEAVGRTPEARAQLVGVLVERGQLDEALAVWASLGDAAAKVAHTEGGRLARALHDQKRFRLALKVFNENAPRGVGGFTRPEQFTDGGFEEDIGPINSRLFGWQVAPSSAGVRVTIDPRGAHGGARSLCLTLNAATQIDLVNFLQFVVVEPNARYRLSFFVRTEELRSAATPLVQVLDASAAQPTPLGASDPVAVGTAPWQQVSFEFATGPHTEAILVRLAREHCPDGVCPIFGKVWYDDFDLQRTSVR